MGKSPRVHFLTAYFEYLLEQGIRTENRYLGDASRFLRFLLAQVTEEDIMRFIESSTDDKYYEQRVKGRLRKFYQFAQQKLDIDNDPFAGPA